MNEDGTIQIDRIPGIETTDKDCIAKRISDRNIIFITPEKVYFATIAEE